MLDPGQVTRPPGRGPEHDAVLLPRRQLPARDVGRQGPVDELLCGVISEIIDHIFIFK